MANRCFAEPPEEPCVLLPTTLTKDRGTWGTLSWVGGHEQAPSASGIGTTSWGHLKGPELWARGMHGCGHC